MDLSPRTFNEAGTREKLWLASEHGTDSLITVTLDLTNGGFTLTDGGYQGGRFPDRVVASGYGIKKHAGTGLYRAVSGTDPADGHLFEDVIVHVDAAGTLTTTKAGGSLFWHGAVVQAKLPGTFVDANRSGKVLYL